VANDANVEGWLPASPLPRPPDLADDEVHVWCASLDRPPLPLEHLIEVLTPDERATAARLHAERDRLRSGSSRGLLRWLLGGYLDVAPGRVGIQHGVRGKPMLANARLRFNVSHADGLLLLAVARRFEVGVDLERLRPLPRALAIADRYFAEREIQALRALPRDRVDEGFFSCWTRKEAYIKAHGKGLAVPLDQFEVALEPTEGAVTIDVHTELNESRTWSLHGLRPALGFVGALAAAGAVRRVFSRTWVRAPI
jgi:4'-phosphopantetheinyl transferase